MKLSSRQLSEVDTIFDRFSTAITERDIHRLREIYAEIGAPHDEAGDDQGEIHRGFDTWISRLFATQDRADAKRRWEEEKGRWLTIDASGR